MLKKIITTAIGLSLCACGFATNQMALTKNQPRFYAAGHIGAGYQNWASKQASLWSDLGLTGVTATWNGEFTNFAFGADAGYQILRYIALEGGIFSLSDSKFTGTDSAGNISGTVSSWLLYAAARVTLLHDDDYSWAIYGKLGASYMLNSVSYSAATSGSRSTTAWAPMLGISGTIKLTHDVYFGVQYLHDFSSTSMGLFQLDIPNTSIGTAQLGITF